MAVLDNLTRNSILQRFAIKNYLLPSSCTRTRGANEQRAVFYLYQFSQISHHNDTSRTKILVWMLRKQAHITAPHGAHFPWPNDQEKVLLQSRALMLLRKSRLPPKNEIFKIKCLLCHSEALNGGVSRQRKQKLKVTYVIWIIQTFHLLNHMRKTAGKGFLKM